MIEIDGGHSPSHQKAMMGAPGDTEMKDAHIMKIDGGRRKRSLSH
jgi:hypothetical protein